MTRPLPRVSKTRRAAPAARTTAARPGIGRPIGRTAAARGAARAPRTVSREALLVNGSDAEFRNLVHDLLAFSHILGVCRDRFGAVIGLTGIQYEIVMAVRRFQKEGGKAGGMSVGQAAARLRRSGAFITIEANKLAAKGILEKFEDPADGRRVLLRVSAKGVELVRQLAVVQQQVNDELFACLDHKRFELLRTLAAELVACGDRASALVEYLSRDAESRAA